MFQELKPMTDKDAAAKLREIFSDLQTHFHDRWDWMEAEFSLQVLEAYISDSREEARNPEDLYKAWLKQLPYRQWMAITKEKCFVAGFKAARNA